MKDVFRMIFRGSIFDSGCYNHPDPYLNCIIVLFDKVHYQIWNHIVIHPWNY